MIASPLQVVPSGELPSYLRRLVDEQEVREVSGVLGGGGGGGATMAQAGGGNLGAIPDALARVREILDQRLAD